ncbi:MAG: short-chain dehydrogenase [Gemmatimonadota bacterium]
MELADRTVMLLGGSGLVGHAVARRVLTATPAPRRLVLVALYEDEVRAAARALEPYRGTVTVDVEWGNLFLPAAVARLDLAVVMGGAEHRALVLGDLFGDFTEAVLERSLLFQLLKRYKPDAVVDSINTATAFAYQDIFQSSRALLDQAKDGGVDRATIEQHLLRLPLPQLVRHAQIITEGLKRAGTQTYVKIGTSGTGGMGFNIPYTHSEERPSATLLAKSAIAGAHSMLLFLLGRTPDAPVTVEIKPTATIAWREVAYGPVRRKGKPIALVDCEAPVPVKDAFKDGARPWRDLGKPLAGVYIDVGENGLFARDEFETVTALGQMEFITPEEVADYVMMELQGRPTGKDIIAALDASTAGPTYRAGMLRRNAVGRLRALEQHHAQRGVAYEMLGPPRLTKLLYEAHLCSRVRSSVRALAESQPAELAAAVYRLVKDEAPLRQHIISVGLPIIVPDGKSLYRGDVVVVAPDPSGDPLAAAPRGWIDLRPQHFGIWVQRAAHMVRDAEQRATGPQSSGSDLDWNAIAPDDTIEPSRFATWVFTVEEKGSRIKR